MLMVVEGRLGTILVQKVTECGKTFDTKVHSGYAIMAFCYIVETLMKEPRFFLAA